MIKFISSISLVASLIYFHTGFATYKLNKKSNEFRWFLIWNLSLAIWSFAYSYAYTAENFYVFSFWNKIAAVGWCTFPALTLYLTLNITKNKLQEYLLTTILIFMPAMILFYMTIFLFGPGRMPGRFISQLFYIGDFFYSFIYLISSIIIIYIWGRKSESYNVKKQARTIVITSIIPFILNLFSQTVLPMVGIIYFPNIGQIYSLIMLWGVSYAIRNFQFMNIPTSLITKELFDKIKGLTFIVDSDGKIIKTGKQGCMILGYYEEELLNTQICDVVKNGNLRHIVNNYEFINETTKLSNVYISSKSGNVIPFDLSVTPLKDIKGRRTLGILIVGQDISPIKQLQNEIVSHRLTSDKLMESEELFRTMVEAAPFAIILKNIETNKLIYINSKAEEFFRVKQDDVVGKDSDEYYFDLKAREDILKDLKEGEVVKEREVTFRRKDNSKLTGLVTIVTSIYKEQKVLLSCVSDVTEQKINEEKLRKIYKEIDKVNKELMEANAHLQEKSIRDSLTNLYNHKYIHEILNNEIDRVKKLNTTLWVAMLDIDYFKSINDNFGHQTGDKVLIEIARIINSSIRNSDYAGRYGGEEFIIILSELSFENACEVAERIRTNIENFDFGLKDTRITASIGLAKLDKDDGKQLENRADALLYLAKKNGRNRIEYEKVKDQ